MIGHHVTRKYLNSYMLTGLDTQFNKKPSCR